MSERQDGTRQIEQAEDFLAAYAERSGLSRETILAHRVVATCACDYEECTGWQVASEDALLPWCGESVVIRG